MNLHIRRLIRSVPTGYIDTCRPETVTYKSFFNLTMAASVATERHEGRRPGRGNSEVLAVPPAPKRRQPIAPKQAAERSFLNGRNQLNKSGLARFLKTSLVVKSCYLEQKNWPFAPQHCETFLPARRPILMPRGAFSGGGS
jgi:hypothetical protein